MQIFANTDLGSKVKIYNNDGTLVKLKVQSYNTKTQVATIYVTGKNGKPVAQNDNGTSFLNLKQVLLLNTYAADENGNIL